MMCTSKESPASRFSSPFRSSSLPLSGFSMLKERPLHDFVSWVAGFQKKKKKHKDRTSACKAGPVEDISEAESRNLKRAMLEVVSSCWVGVGNDAVAFLASLV